MDDNLRKLYDAIEAKDADQVDDFMYDEDSGFSLEYIPALIELPAKP